MDELVEGDRTEEEELHDDDATHGVTAEAREYVGHLTQERHLRHGADRPERQAENERRAREQEEAAPAVERLEERLDAATRDVDALEAEERGLDGPRDARPPVHREHLPKARARHQREELRALELPHEVRDDVEVELAVLEDVRGRDALERRVAVHLLPEELLAFGQEQEAVCLRVLQDEGPLAGHARLHLRDLEGRGGDPLGARLEEPERATDLADLEALVVAPDEELELRGHRARRPGGHGRGVREAGALRGWPASGALGVIVTGSARPAHSVGGPPQVPLASSHYRGSTSSPVASSPHRVASVRRRSDPRRRSMKTWTIA